MDGVGIAVEEVGSGPPLLLLHGFTGTAATWSDQLPALRESNRIIAVDLLGHGRSDAPGEAGRYAVERQADDMVAVLDSRGFDTATVLGYSMGARIALALAADHPDRVEALLLESPSAGISDPQERARRIAADAQLADDIERHGITAFVDDWETRPLFASHVALPPETRTRLRNERLSQRPSGLAGALRGGGQGAMSPLHDRLGSIRCPSLVIAGALDTAGTDRARVVAAGLADARLEVIDAAGHAPHLERPDDFGALISTFLSTLRTQRPH